MVGTGIAGLGAAWALHLDNEIVVYEAAEHLGGHSNTVDVETSGGPIPVDTGFIVYNETTYPHLTRLFATLGVQPSRATCPSAFSLDGPSNTRRVHGTRGPAHQPPPTVDIDR